MYCSGKFRRNFFGFKLALFNVYCPVLGVYCASFTVHSARRTFVLCIWVDCVLRKVHSRVSDGVRGWWALWFLQKVATLLKTESLLSASSLSQQRWTNVLGDDDPLFMEVVEIKRGWVHFLHWKTHWQLLTRVILARPWLRPKTQTCSFQDFNQRSNHTPLSIHFILLLGVLFWSRS